MVTVFNCLHAIELDPLVSKHPEYPVPLIHCQILFHMLAWPSTSAAGGRVSRKVSGKPSPSPSPLLSSCRNVPFVLNELFPMIMFTVSRAYSISW